MRAGAAIGSRPALAGLLLAAHAACGAVSCGPATPPATEWPAGTVLAVDGLALSGAEVDQVTAWVAAVLPSASEKEHRRRALTGHLFPRLTAEAAFASERTQALARAEQTLADLRETPAAVDSARVVSGDWGTIGLEVWAALQEARSGEWIGPLAGIGRLRLARCLERTPGPHPGLDLFEIEVRDFPFVPPGTDRNVLAEMTWDAELTIVDPAYERIVPLAWRANMQAQSDRTPSEPPATAAAGGSPE